MVGVKFYSTQRQSNVFIPANKVCGYRIKNPIMKKGYSSGVRAGIDNGVVNQKLSRFSEDYEAERVYKCEGNTNWLNGRKPQFNKAESADNQFSIKRPSFLEGSSIHSIQAQELKPNNRAGLGNRDITRNNFLASEIKARQFDLEKLQIMPISDVYTSDAVGANQLSYSTVIKVPDPTDFQWLNEKERLERELTRRFTNAGIKAEEIPAMIERELAINKPLGRPQRTINKTTNDIANSKLTTEQKVKEIIQEVKDGRAEGRISRGNIAAQLIRILADTNAILALGRTELTNLGASLATMGFPTNYIKLGIGPRYVDVNFYNQNTGIINLLLFSKVREITKYPNAYNYSLIVKNLVPAPLQGMPLGIPAIKLNSAVTALGRANDRRYFDLENGGVINLRQLRQAAASDKAGGFNGPNFSIDPQLQ
jgi:hypothetical protein